MILFVLSITFLVLFAAICSGLNISIMSLDPADLRRKSKLGSKQAKRVLPLRQNSHLTLAAILLTNVAAASATALVLESKFNGLIAGAAATFLLVIFGEIMPQALFTRRALAFCSFLTPLMRFMIIATYPISKPLQLVLDKLFGHAEHQLHSRHELGIMISEHLGRQESELDEDEVEIIRGALQLSEKRVREIMVPIEQVFWLTPDTVIDETKIYEIKAAGRSRIPVFNRRLTRNHGVLLMKDLVDIDFRQKKPRVDDLMVHSDNLIGSMTALDTMFRKFIAAKTHLLPIERDDQIVGIVTIEDLIEEILGHEIEDETDRRQKKRRSR